MLTHIKTKTTWDLWPLWWCLRMNKCHDFTEDSNKCISVAWYPVHYRFLHDQVWRNGLPTLLKSLIRTVQKTCSVQIYSPCVKHGVPIYSWNMVLKYISLVRVLAPQTSLEYILLLWYKCICIHIWSPHKKGQHIPLCETMHTNMYYYFSRFYK